MTFDGPARPFAIIVVPFPYSDKFAEKRRPALVISNEWLLSEAGVVWIAMITGAGKDRRPGDVLIADLAAAGLAGPSMLRLSKLATIEPARILRTIGSLTREERRAVSDCLAAFLAKP